MNAEGEKVFFFSFLKKKATNTKKPMMRKLILALSASCLVGLFDASAQQDPQYTQYMYIPNVMNPAYAGTKESLSLGLLYRDQYSGFEGAPQTFTFGAHTPLGEKTGLGISAIKDEIGPVEETNAYIDFSYRFDLSNSLKLSFGVKAGATFHNVGLLDLQTIDGGDPAFSSNVDETFANIGAGFFLYSDNFYFGAAVPNMLESVHLDAEGVEYGSEERHFFATAGYVFQLSENVKLKPSALVKTSFGFPLSFNINTNAKFFERFEIGASYRYEDAVSGLVGVRIADWVKVGFAYDHTLSDIEEPSYEAMVLFDVFFKEKTYRSPRYF